MWHHSRRTLSLQNEVVMKVRINVLPIGGFRFSVERKRWWGWQTLYKADVLKYCEEYIRDLQLVRKVEWIKD
jgi:hypothetical protein